MRSILPLFALSFLLSACVDTTGLTKTSSKQPKGNPTAAVIVQEFADIQCPACKAAQEQVTTPLLAKYGNQIRFEFKHFPLRTIHPYAFEAAQAAECAADQRKFWEFIDMAYEKQRELKSDALRAWGAALGLDVDLFDRCIRSDFKSDIVLSDFKEGEARGVTGTPTFFVSGMKVPSTIADLSVAIDQALAQIESAPL